MHENILVIGGHGAGDCILSLQCAHYVPHSNFEIFLSARDEVFRAIQHCFSSVYYLKQIDEKYGENNNILNKPEWMEELGRGYDEVYYVIPDLLFRNPYAFDFKKYRVHPQVVKQTRLLVAEAAQESIVYLGLMTTTPGYLYQDLPKLVVEVAKALPNHTIYLPWIEKWANENTNLPQLPASLPGNVFVDTNPEFTDSLEWLRKSCYFVGTCNGPSHIAYQYGIPRLILDPQFNRLPWIARWKEDYSECIPIQYQVNQVVEVIKTNIETPQTCLIPRMHVLTHSPCNWAGSLFFKF
jgi:hypothetical protein